jgi:hypothetical protein
MRGTGWKGPVTREKDLNLLPSRYEPDEHLPQSNLPTIALRAPPNLFNQINAICPVQSCQQKYSASSTPQISDKTTPSRPGRGALAIVTNVGAGCGGRGSVGRVVVFSGRALVRERTQRADDRRQMPGEASWRSRGAAYGKTVWFWHPLLVSS